MQIQVVEGNLVDQNVDVIVNAWNRNILPQWLLLPRGVSRDIKLAAGAGPFQELARRGPIRLGGAVLTGPGALKNCKSIIHVAGINMFWRATDESIRGSLRSALDIVRQQGYRTVAFPLIGSGCGGMNADKVLQFMQTELAKITFDGTVIIVRWKRDS